MHQWEPGIIWFPLCAICHCAWRVHWKAKNGCCDGHEGPCGCPGFAFETLSDHPRGPRQELLESEDKAKVTTSRAVVLAAQSDPVTTCNASGSNSLH
jgi:hypothetical protein